MIKALVTVEGVGNVLQPGIDIVEASRKDVQHLLLEQFNPLAILKTSVLVVPELLDILNRSPLILSESLRQFERSLGKSPDSHPEGLQMTVLVVMCFLVTAALFASGASWPLWAGLFILIVVLILKK
jgi:predicted unusual protein kinase regulating ubiquinone biosynthesis (AarF/ABC1/UbiB family)